MPARKFRVIPGATQEGTRPRMEAESKQSGRAARAGLVALLCALAALAALQPVRSADFWHHLKAGEYAAQHGPARTEPFAHTARGREWIQFEWLAQLMLYLGYRHAGPTPLILVKAALAALAFGLLLRACVLRARSMAPAAIAAMAAVCALAPRSFVRPEMFSLPLLGVCLLLLEAAGRGRRRALWWLVPVFALWPNLHGLYAGALALVGVAAVGDAIAVFLRRWTWGWNDTAGQDRPCHPSEKSDASGSCGASGVAGPVLPGPVLQPGAAVPQGTGPVLRRRFLWRWAVLPACLAATLCNPYGWRVWAIPFRLIGSPIFKRVIGEWQRSEWSMLAEPCYWPVLLLTLLALRYARRLHPADILRLLVFGFLAVVGKRHLSLYAFVCAPVFAAALEPALGGVAKKVVSVKLRAIGAAALLLLMAWGALGWPAFSHLGLGIRREVYPVKAAAFLRREAIPGRLFNTYRLGNYFLWRLDQEMNPVFIDGRIDMYGPGILADYEEIQAAGPRWREKLDRYGVEIVILAIRAKGDQDRLADRLMASADWNLVYWDDRDLLFLKNIPRYGEVIARLGIWRIRPDAFDVRTCRDREMWRRAVAEFERKLAQDPACIHAHDLLASCYEVAGLYREAVPHYAAVLGADPKSGAAAYNLGAALLRTGEHERAEGLLLMSLRHGAPPVPALRTLGNLYYETKRYDRAIAVYRRALRIAPDDWRTYWNLSIACGPA